MRSHTPVNSEAIRSFYFDRTILELAQIMHVVDHMPCHRCRWIASAEILRLVLEQGGCCAWRPWPNRYLRLMIRYPEEWRNGESCSSSGV